MPIAIIQKIMARELSHLGYAKISHDAKTLVQEAATEFICFIMSEANDQALQAKRKSVSGQDIINACDSMDMREMVQPMTNALPHLQPPKRVRGKATDQDSTGNPSQPNRRRRCHVSDRTTRSSRSVALALRACLRERFRCPNRIGGTWSRQRCGHSRTRLETCSSRQAAKVSWFEVHSSS